MIASISTSFNITKLVIAYMVIASLVLACSKKETGGGTIPPPPPPPAVDTVPSLASARSWLVDKNATEETAALFYKLKKTAKTNILFGHQDATKHGIGWSNEEDKPYQPLKSDVKEVTGAYPIVYGGDFSFVAGKNQTGWFAYENSTLRNLTVDAYNRGGVNTFSWHYGNPVSGGDFYWDKSPVEAVSKIIPGGSHHDSFKKDLRKIGDFAKSLIGADGKLVPVIFRPFHEFDGGWFWWGATHSTAQQYKDLFRFTVTYLRDSLNVRNFLYGWSPDRGYSTLSAFMERYPGDGYVDLVGMDNYGDLAASQPVTTASNKLKIISDYAKINNKIAALTETGLQNLPKANWYTDNLLKVLTAQKLELAYVLVWTNRTGTDNGVVTNTFWTPPAGNAAVPDFIAFKNNGYVLFGDKTPKMYELK